MQQDIGAQRVTEHFCTCSDPCRPGPHRGGGSNQGEAWGGKARTKAAWQAMTNHLGCDPPVCGEEGKFGGGILWAVGVTAKVVYVCVGAWQQLRTGLALSGPALLDLLAWTGCLGPKASAESGKPDREQLTVIHHGVILAGNRCSAPPAHHIDRVFANGRGRGQTAGMGGTATG